VDGDYGVYKKGSVWAEPDIDEAADYMRRVFDNIDEVKLTAEKGMEYIRKFYNPSINGNAYIERFNKIMQIYESGIFDSKSINAKLSNLDSATIEIYNKLVYASKKYGKEKINCGY
jgi:hypothetical protein